MKRRHNRGNCVTYEQIVYIYNFYVYIVLNLYLYTIRVVRTKHVNRVRVHTHTHTHTHIDRSHRIDFLFPRDIHLFKSTAIIIIILYTVRTKIRFLQFPFYLYDIYKYKKYTAVY